MGFFGTLNGTVKNLTLKGSKVKGRNQVGFLSGSANNCTVENCTFEGSSEGVSNIGGCIGTSNTVSLSYISFAGDIIGTGDCVGGIIGTSEGTSSLTVCEFNGNQVSGNNYVGGICGTNKGKNSIVSKCYAYTTLNGKDYVGGICGMIKYQHDSDSYSGNV